jgi:hypothetical protein
MIPEYLQELLGNNLFRQIYFAIISATGIENVGNFSPKLRLTFNGIHGVISQKIELLITAEPQTLHVR